MPGNVPVVGMRLWRFCVKRTGFTLIELLIVVAIIGILAAIAVPNFLNAQVRAKVSRVQSDLRAIAVSTDMYRLDWNAFPWPKSGLYYISGIHELTTPVAYIGDVNLQDPFNPANMQETLGADVPTYVWVNYQGAWGTTSAQSKWGAFAGQFPQGYALNSQGPDHQHSGGSHIPLELKFDQAVVGGNVPAGNPYDKLYDTSNGLNSLGDIVRYGGEVAGIVSGC